MTRLNDHQVVQRVDDDIVLVDESTGEEVVVLGPDVPRLLSAVHALVAP